MPFHKVRELERFQSAEVTFKDIKSIGNGAIRWATYNCMYDILPPKGMCSESRDLFTFWEISDNISLMMQDKDSCNGPLLSGPLQLSLGGNISYMH